MPTGPRILAPERMSVAELEEETRFTLAAVRHKPETRGLERAAEALHDSVKAALLTLRRLEEAQLEAEVRVSLANRDLDACVTQLRSVVQSKGATPGGAALYERFFGRFRPSVIIRMSLTTELPVVAPWVESLKGDADPELKQQGVALEKVVADGQAAVSALAAVRQARRDFRSGPHVQLFELVNTGRQKLSDELLKLCGEDFYEGFFRSGHAPGPSEESTLASARELVEQRRTELANAEATLAAHLSQAENEQRQEEARTARQKERAELEKQIAALREKAEAIKD